MRDRDVMPDTLGILLAGLFEAEKMEPAPVSERRRFASGVYPVGERRPPEPEPAATKS